MIIVIRKDIGDTSYFEQLLTVPDEGVADALIGKMNNLNEPYIKYSWEKFL